MTSSTCVRGRLTAWIVLVLALWAGEALWLRSPTLAGSAALGAGLLGIMALLKTTPPSAIRLPAAWSATVVLGGAVALEMAALLLPSPPGTAGFAGWQTPWQSGVAALGPIHRLLSHRALAATCAIAADAVVLRILGDAGQSAWWAILMAWNPVVVLASGGMGHPDAAALLLLVLVLGQIQRQRFKTAAAALAAAAAVEPLALVLLPFLWRQTHEYDSFRSGRQMLIVFAAAALLIMVPAWVWAGGWHGDAGDPRGWPPADGLVYQLIGAPAGLVALPLGLGAAAMLWQLRPSAAEAGYWLFMILLLVSPRVDPGDLMAVACFLPLVRGPQGYAGLVWTAAAAGSGTWTGSMRAESHPLAPYVPVVFALAAETVCLLRRPVLARGADGRGPLALAI